MRKEFDPSDWWFSTWQPEDVPLNNDSVKTEDWQLQAEANWHGFAGLTSGQAILDPIKVT